jgi:hypothetical protein
MFRNFPSRIGVIVITDYYPGEVNVKLDPIIWKENMFQRTTIMSKLHVQQDAFAILDTAKEFPFIYQKMGNW